MSTSAARSLERDFDQLYLGGEQRAGVQQQQYGRQNAPPVHPFKNGLPTFKPVIYPNPGAGESSSDEEDEDGTTPAAAGSTHVASSFQRVIDTQPPRIFSAASSRPYKAEIATSVAVGNYPQRIGQQGLASATPHYTGPFSQQNHPGQHSYASIESHGTGITNSPSTHSYASIDSRDQDSLFDEEEYLPPPVPNRVSYGSIGSQSVRVADSNYKPPPPSYQVPSYQGGAVAYSQAMASRNYVPQSAPSRLVYTTSNAKQGGYAESRPMQGIGTTELPADPNMAPADAYMAAEAHLNNPHSYNRQPSGYSGGSSPTSPTKEGKEAEVDALTNLLMQNMKAAADPDFFGMCTRCGKPVKGQFNGLAALDRVYHLTCFSCCRCGIRLDGQPFYAMEGKPYCEGCYMNTLEKCSVCSKAITDRVLRATGKPYHPGCFVCVVCGKSLDGVPFTVDATNQIHCIEDFHRKFAPRCCVCNQPIMPSKGEEETVRIVAMDRSFHVNCYKCEDCGIVLSSEAEGRGCYPLDDHILCKNCNAHRIQAMTTKMTTEL